MENEDIRVIFASDVQGPISDGTLDMIIGKHPSLVYLGGPPLHLSDYRVPNSVLEHGLKNAGKLVEKIPTVILDHHLLRSEGWREASNMIFESALDSDHRVDTAASFIGEKEKTLESY
ncbi:MAG: hypothetical protein V1850_07690 [Candidatus Bathyarchaeota archaeon]